MEGKKHTELDEKLFAVEFIAAASPALPPDPVMKLHTTSNTKWSSETATPSPIPSSYIFLIPKYPTRRTIQAPMSGILGPLRSTIRPQIGPVV
jgi:hypothetical protein